MYTKCFRISTFITPYIQTCQNLTPNHPDIDYLRLKQSINIFKRERVRQIKHINQPTKDLYM
jgi:hypothetical protein